MILLSVDPERYLNGWLLEEQRRCERSSDYALSIIPELAEVGTTLPHNRGGFLIDDGDDDDDDDES